MKYFVRVFVLKSICSKCRKSTPQSNTPPCHHPTPREAWDHPSKNCWWVPSKRMRIQLWLFHHIEKSKHLNVWVAWRVRTRIVLLSTHRHKTISARHLNRNLSIVMLTHMGKDMYQFRLPNVTELVVLCIPVEKYLMPFLGRLQVTNAHFNLKRKAPSHQFSMPDYIKTQVRHC